MTKPSRVNDDDDLPREASSAGDRAEAAYATARAAYTERHLDVADRWIAKALDDATGILYARALALGGWVAEARGDYAAAVRSLRLALGALRNVDERDDDLMASILRTLASFAAELADAELAEFVRAQAAPFVWPAAAAEARVQTEIDLGLAALDQGEVDRALDAFDTADVSALRLALLAEARLESAEVYRLIGEPVAARRLLRSAGALLRAADWSQVQVEDHLALLESVCLAARLDDGSVSEWLTRYAALAEAEEGRVAAATDRRVAALELHARGLAEAWVAEKGGAGRVRAAFELWESLGYVRRAAYAAADLLALGERIEPGRLRRLIEALPNHPLAAALQRAPGELRDADGIPVTLSPEQRRVLEALCAGVSVREMARQWERSEFTIRNHLKKLFAKFEVISSAALVAKAMASGVVGPSPKLPPRKPPREQGASQEG
jgi:DNA-binding CsgD family transcriptional regulator